MQRWEYKVLSLDDGMYTDTLNAYGRAGWELVAVAPDVHEVHAAREEEGSLPLPVPRALEPQSGVLTTLLWVLRRPLPDEDDEFEFES